MPEISVIMLTYNREKYIRTMIEAVLSQTFELFEFIIVDNGSMDNSGVIADEYATMDKRIKVYHIKKGTIGYGRNYGLDKAKGKYIAFVDDDDRINENYLEVLYNDIEDNKAEVSICSAFGRENDRKGVMSSQEAIETLLDRELFNMAFPTKLIARQLFEENRFNEYSKYDDIYLMPHILATANRISYNGKALYEFVRHDGNNSSWTTNFNLLTEEILREYLDVYHERTKWLIDRYPLKKDVWRYFENSFIISMIDKIYTYNIESCKDIKSELIRYFKNESTSFISNEKTKEFEKDFVKEYIL